MKKAVHFLLLLLLAVVTETVVGQDNSHTLVKTVKGKKVCRKGWECNTWSTYCCNQTISDFFQTYQFENLFSKRNSPIAHAVGFWDYRSFITSSALFQPLGFGTTGGKLLQQLEVAAFLGHVGSQTSCNPLPLVAFVFLFLIIRVQMSKCCCANEWVLVSGSRTTSLQTFGSISLSLKFVSIRSRSDHQWPVFDFLVTETCGRWLYCCLL